MTETVDKREETLIDRLSFNWSEELVAECSRYVSEQREQSDVWTSDYTAEKSCIENFKRQRLLERVVMELNPHNIEKGEKCIVDKETLGGILEYLVSKVQFE
ncbi:MAG: hypothetical protein PQJ49_12495 [Sphaerochaetaceae bacterium]|nr:hypothetical protein [Sphaerochaetaceae bacterium]